MNLCSFNGLPEQAALNVGNIIAINQAENRQGTTPSDPSVDQNTTNAEQSDLTEGTSSESEGVAQDSENAESSPIDSVDPFAQPQTNPSPEETTTATLRLRES